MREDLIKRAEVLSYSLTLELMASFSLSYILDISIENIEKSKSLGNTSSSLSFNQKINLLLDNNSITKSEKIILEAFMSIRNQFMHNKGADTYLKAVNHISGLQNRLKKIYPELFDKTDIEITLKECVSKLYSESISILGDFKGGREKKMKNEVERKLYKKRYQKLNEIMILEIDKVNSFINDYKSNSIEKDELLSKIGLLKYQILLKTNKEMSK